MRNITLIVPIAYDAIRPKRGEVICGPGTIRACEEAVKEAKGTMHPRILLTACEIPDCPGVIFAHLMRDVIWSIDPTIEVCVQIARFFNTIGELLGVADYTYDLPYDDLGVCRCERDIEVIEHVIFTVKDWHEDRTRALQQEIFFYKKVRVPVNFKTHRLPWTIRRRIDSLLEFPKKLYHLRKVRRMEKARLI